MATRKRATKSRPARPTEGPPPAGNFPSERELIVIARPEIALRASPSGVLSAAGADIAPLAELVTSEGITMRPLFGPSEERIQHAALSFASGAVADIPDLSVFYKVEAPEERLDEIASRLQEQETIEAAFVKPPAEPAVWADTAPAPEEAPPATPDFTLRQGYLDAAPAGIDARFAWTRPGGRGANMRIVDIEGAWNFSHEDLLQNQGGIGGGTPTADLGWRNHGTAVAGEFSGDNNNFGVTGICPDANVRGFSIFGPGSGSAQAITRAANSLQAGDIILLELHRPGPRFNFASRADQRGYIAIEWWPDDLAAVRFAVARGIIVVEAAGNGAENLDDPIYSTRPAGFPSSWTNPFRRSPVDSGAIVVGAGAPPPGTHGRNHGPDRSRLDFSNFGALVDAQGWGREVTTTGYGDLQGGANENLWYTDQFSGTSSASPIVVGALGCLQGAVRAAGRPVVTPAQARNFLRTTGSPQQDAPGRPATQRIGNRPNLRDLMRSAGVKGKEILKEAIKDKEIVKEQKDRKDIIKEAKEKDRKDVKDKEKEGKELIKEKEIRKEIRKELKEKEIREIPGAQTGFGEGLEERLARIEQAVAQLFHFIGAELRPDLTASALTGESDLQNEGLQALSQELEKQAADAKQAKDNKDMEKLTEV